MNSSDIDDRPTRWNILYRGSLSSCNYECAYCPFAKTSNSRAELQRDSDALNRFVDWVSTVQGRHVGVLFTPWGEALIHRSYQKAIVELSHMDHVRKVAIQTNLSGPTGWLTDAAKDTVALWTTYHPSQVKRSRFLAKCGELDQRATRYSVGMVGLTSDLDEIEAVREVLRDDIYLWVNAYKDEPDYYRPDDIDRIRAVDPHFSTNLKDYESLGRACRAGHTSFTVDHDGTARRCHFIDRPIGNIYDPDFETALSPTGCSRKKCDCYIGYIHLREPDVSPIFGDGLLERIPSNWGVKATR